MTARSYWNRAFAAAPGRIDEGLKPFTKTALKKALSWPDCACGTADPRIHRDFDGGPFDDDLARLGLRFSRWVNSANLSTEREFRLVFVGEAEKTMAKIDARAAEILAGVEE